MTKKKYLPSEEIAMFCDQVVLLLKAGISLSDGLDVLSQNYKESKYAVHFKKMSDILHDRHLFYMALESTGLFPDYAIKMVQIGEKTGKLETVMQMLADYYYKEAKTKHAIKSAVMYPTVLIVMMAVIIGVLVLKVMPVFNQIYMNLGVELYDTSSVFINVGRIFGQVVLIAIGIILLFLLIGLIVIKTDYRMAFLERVGHMFPSIRKIWYRIEAGRFASVFSVMLASGLHIEEALNMVPMILSSNIFKSKIDQLRERTLQNISFSEAVSDLEIFDDLYNKMLIVGASAGQTEKVMNKISDIYFEDTDESIARLIARIEPTSVIILSVFIGAILLAVIMPLLGIVSNLG